MRLSQSPIRSKRHILMAALMLVREDLAHGRHGGEQLDRTRTVSAAAHPGKEERKNASLSFPPKTSICTDPTCFLCWPMDVMNDFMNLF